MENSLIKACRHYEKALITQLLNKGVHDIDFQDNIGNSSLHYLCNIYDHDLTEKMLDMGADINIKNLKGETPLHMAAALGEVKLIELLISNGADISIKTYEGITPLVTAIRNRNIQAAKVFIFSGADKYAVSVNHLSVLDYIKAESLDELLVFFKEGFPKLDTKGNTPLHHAVNQNGVSTVRDILNKDRTFIDVRNKKGLTPLLIAISNLNYGITDLLLKFGANPNLVREDNNASPLHTAALNGISWLGEILLEYKANINALDNEGATPLILAVRGHHREFISLLLRRGADINITDDSGKKAIDYAKDWGTKELMEIFNTYISNTSAKIK